MKCCVFTLVLLSLSLVTPGQNDSKRCKWVNSFDQPISLDTLTIYRQSINFPDHPSKIIGFTYDVNTGLMTIQQPTGVDSIQICYQVLPFNLNKRLFRRDLSIYDSSAYFKDQRITGNLLNRREELFTSPGLSKSGSISRGISVGNNQNVFVNSSLNLQLEGKLTDDISIRAVISDQNVPFQPEGNTQQLQEFDNVFVQLYNKKGSLMAGDVVFKNQPSYFLKYYRNVQGGFFQIGGQPSGIGNRKANKSEKSVTRVGIAVAKGKFASDQIEVSEGILGPYRINGPANERFIIILANSEKVYLDGKILKRGFNYDYVIDYNLSEITFTNKVLITKFSRVRVDFEFSDRNYSRTITQADHKQSLGNFDFFINAYSEKDNPNRPLTFDLSDEDKEQFSISGDDVPLAIAHGGDSVLFNENSILYKKIDTVLANGVTTTIFKFSADPDSAVFNVSFTNVGIGEGNYIQSNANANGRVYEWIAPESGVPMGEFEPVRVLPAPTKKQMAVLGASYKIKKVGVIFGEIAMSDQDINLFSTNDANDDGGYAVKIGYQSDDIPIKFFKGYNFNTLISYEFDNQNFKSIDRFRYIEFDRDWSYVPRENDPLFNDNIFIINSTVTKDEVNTFSYKWVKRSRGSLVEGEQHRAQIAKTFGNLVMNGDAFFMKNKQSLLSSNWHRLNWDISWKSKLFIPGYHYSEDRNELRNTLSDSLVSTAMNFSEHRFYLRNSDSLSTTFSIDYSIREDRLPVAGVLENSNHSETLNFAFGGLIKKNHRINTLFTYRTIENLIQRESEPLQEETVMGRLDWGGSFFRKVINANLTYAIGNGRELKREFLFLQVPTGDGTHTWRDDNNDNIQDLGEFFEAINTDERNYIKILQPTNEFIQAHTNNLVFRFDLKLPPKWATLNGFKKLLYRFSNTTSINMLQKFTNTDIGTRLFSFAQVIEDEELIATRESIRSTLFFNGSNPKYGFDISLFENRRKQLFSGGFEDVKDKSINLNSRINIQKSWDIRVQLKKGEKSNQSDFLLERNYFITQYSMAPLISWQPGNQFRLSGGYTYRNRENILIADLNEKALSNEFTMDLRISKVNKGNLGIGFRLVDIDFEGDENSAVGYELLQALRPGTNLTWSVNLQQRIAGGLQLSVNYEGRKSPERSIVHLGRIQVRALF